jgi:hypothetical protein
MVESPERTMRDVAALAAMGLKPVTGTQRGPNGDPTGVEGMAGHQDGNKRQVTV